MICIFLQVLELIDMKNNCCKTICIFSKNIKRLKNKKKNNKRKIKKSLISKTFDIFFNLINNSQWKNGLFGLSSSHGSFNASQLFAFCHRLYRTVTLNSN